MVEKLYVTYNDVSSYQFSYQFSYHPSFTLSPPWLELPRDGLSQLLYTPKIMRPALLST